jgi:hypothetical protein
MADTEIKKDWFYITQWDVDHYSDEELVKRYGVPVERMMVLEQTPIGACTSTSRGSYYGKE